MSFLTKRLQAYNYENYARELDQLKEKERIERMIGDNGGGAPRLAS